MAEHANGTFWLKDKGRLAKHPPPALAQQDSVTTGVQNNFHGPVGAVGGGTGPTTINVPMSGDDGERARVRAAVKRLNAILPDLGLSDEALADFAEAMTQLTRQAGSRDPDRNRLYRVFQRIKSIRAALQSCGEPGCLVMLFAARPW